MKNTDVFIYVILSCGKNVDEMGPFDDGEVMSFEDMHVLLQEIGKPIIIISKVWKFPVYMIAT